MLLGCSATSVVGKTPRFLRAPCSHTLRRSYHGESRRLQRCRAGEGGSKGGDDGEGDLLENLFRQEVEKRKAAESSQQRASSSGGSGGSAGGTTGPGGAESSTRTQPPPSFPRDPETPSQLEKSRALNSEGLEGLIPRGSVLIRLGLSFTLAFGPFILAVALAFGGLYAVFGDAFIHSGTAGAGPPPYIDPDLLLNEPTADPTVAFRDYPSSY